MPIKEGGTKRRYDMVAIQYIIAIFDEINESEKK